MTSTVALRLRRTREVIARQMAEARLACIERQLRAMRATCP